MTSVEQMDVVQFKDLIDNRELTRNEMGFLLLNDSWELIEVLVQKNIPFPTDCITFAAWVNNLDLAKRLYELGYKPLYGAMALAAARNQWDFAEWLIDQNVSRNDDSWCMGYCAGFGNLHAMKKLFKWGFPLSDRVAGVAAEYGHLDMLIWLHDNGCSFNPSIIDKAHPDVMKWMKSLFRD